MKHISSSDARQNLPDIINQVAYKKKRVLLTRRGKKLVAIVPIEDLELLEKLESIIKKD